MTKKRKAVYPSRYSPEKTVHAAQYITELICEKKAKMENKELPIKFWELADWLKFYKYQITLANQLLKKYDEHSIIAALHDKRMWKTYSLRSPFLKNVIVEYHKKQELSKKIAQNFEYHIVEEPTFNTSSSKKDSVISKLRDLDE